MNSGNSEPSCLVPGDLERLARHPERGQWRLAILLSKHAERWPGWPLQMALATVDSSANVHHGSLLVRPPFGWDELPDRDLPADITDDQIRQTAVTPWEMAQLLNDVFRTQSVFTNSSWGRRWERRLEQVIGLSFGWRSKSIFSVVGEDLDLSLNEACYVEFKCHIPGDGSLADRAKTWARRYVTAWSAQRAVMGALNQSEMPFQTRRAD